MPENICCAAICAENIINQMHALTYADDIYAGMPAAAAKIFKSVARIFQAATGRKRQIKFINGKRNLRVMRNSKSGLRKHEKIRKPRKFLFFIADGWIVCDFKTGAKLFPDHSKKIIKPANYVIPVFKRKPAQIVGKRLEKDDPV